MAGSSFITRSTSTLESLMKRSRPKVGVNLVDQTDGFVSSYTTGDKIEGEVTIFAEHNTHFDEVDITFEGASRISVERATTVAGQTGQSTAYHTFLKLHQPVDETAYPVPRVLEAGRTYKFPFTFVVPDHLLPQSCNHAKSNLHIQQAHTQLPPSLGDPMLAGDGTSLLDDMAPQMTQVSYVIKISILRKPLAEGEHARALIAAAKKVRIIPAADEQPPLNVADDSEDYCLRKEKDVKKGLLRGKYGRLVLAASQPRPLQLRPPNPSSSCPASTVATLHLRFDPTGDEQPPRLGKLWTKIKASTFYSIIPWSDFPTKSRSLAWMHSRGVYTETVPLSSRCVASAQWEKHSNANAIDRRGSMQSISSAESLTGPSASYSGKMFYTASILVPITLPKCKAFVPTFYSCLISRVYVLDLCVSYHTPNANVLAPTSSLKIPIQITCARREGSITGYAPELITHTEVDQEFFLPRSVAPPSLEYMGRSSASSDSYNSVHNTEPPEYSDLAPLSRHLGYPDGELLFPESSPSASPPSSPPADRTVRAVC